MEHLIVHDSMNVYPIQMKIMSKCRWKREEQSFGSIGKFQMHGEEKNQEKSSKSLLWKLEWQQWVAMQTVKWINIKCCWCHLSLQCSGISSSVASRTLFHSVAVQSCGVSSTQFPKKATISVEATVEEQVKFQQAMVKEVRRSSEKITQQWKEQWESFQVTQC